MAFPQGAERDSKSLAVRPWKVPVQRDVIHGTSAIHENANVGPVSRPHIL
jgi:hypothetical protein